MLQREQIMRGKEHWPPKCVVRPPFSLFTCLSTTQQRLVTSPWGPGVVSLHVNAGHFSTTARRVTSPTWGPPPPCKQALIPFKGTVGTRTSPFVLILLIQMERWLQEFFLDMSTRKSCGHDPTPPKLVKESAAAISISSLLRSWTPLLIKDTTLSLVKRVN